MEDYFKKYDFLNQGHILGLGFAEGILFVEIMSREPKFFEHTFPTLGPNEGMADWDTIPKDNTERYIEPTETTIIYQFYYGLKPSTARLYFRFPSKTDRWTLIDPIDLDSPNGGLYGEWSPYDDPSVITELFTLKDVYPAFKVKNTTPETITPKIRFIGMAYEYEIVYDKDLIKDYIEMRRRRKLYYLGGTAPHVKAPNWLIQSKGVRELLEYSREVLNRVHGR